METTNYVTADGRIIPVDSTACKRSPVTTFTEKGGKVVYIVRWDCVAELSKPVTV
jgi:hypothetical protein